MITAWKYLLCGCMFI